MALWQILTPAGDGHHWQENGVDVHTFDDGLAFMPEEEGFSRTAADKFARKCGKGFTAAYMGTPNWHARIERDARDQAEAEEAARRAADAAANTPQARLAAAREAGRRAAAEAEFEAQLQAAFEEGRAQG